MEPRGQDLGDGRGAAGAGDRDQHLRRTSGAGEHAPREGIAVHLRQVEVDQGEVVAARLDLAEGRHPVVDDGAVVVLDP